MISPHLPSKKSSHLPFQASWQLRERWQDASCPRDCPSRAVVAVFVLPGFRVAGLPSGLLCIASLPSSLCCVAGLSYGLLCVSFALTPESWLRWLSAASGYFPCFLPADLLVYNVTIKYTVNDGSIEGEALMGSLFDATLHRGRFQ